MIYSIWVGLVLMVLGTLKSLFVSDFKYRMHTIGISDTAGVSLVILGLALMGFQPLKMMLGLVFLLIWSPMLIHVLAKLHISRLRK